MDKLSDIFVDLNQTESNVIDEQNLNAVWVDLDKGLQSDNIGQQCEAIVKFTDLFDRIPLPVFVNIGFLRLAKVFQSGSNFIKLNVVRVIEKNQKHLEKIVSIDELTRLILHNIHSNDSTCRALTLRALAELAPIIYEKQNVHHHIRTALESFDDIEAKEAVYAANRFCSISKKFADSLCDHITQMIEDVATPIDRKMNLIPILVNMHHDTQLALKAKSVCKFMFDSFPRTDLRAKLLNTLTKISCKSLTNIHDTLVFFIQLLHNEPREKLILVLLNNLYVLARNASHLWTKDNIQNICLYLNNLDNELLVLKTLKVLNTLATKSNIHLCLEFSSKSTLLSSNIKNKLFHSNIEIAYNSCSLATKLLIFAAKNLGKNSEICLNEYEEIFELTKNAIYSLIMNCEKDDTISNRVFYLKHVLKCTIDLAEINVNTYLEEVFSFLLSHLNSLGPNSMYYCDALLTLGAHNINYLKLNETMIVNIINKSIVENKCLELQYKLIVLFLQANILSANKNESNAKLDSILNKFVQRSTDYWINYKLARLCVRYSYYNYATTIFESLIKLISNTTIAPSTPTSPQIKTQLVNQRTNNHIKQYFEFYHYICKAESYLIKLDNIKNFTNLIENLNESLELYIKAQILFKAFINLFVNCNSTASGQNNNNNASYSYQNNFQLKYIELRIEQIKLFIHLALATMTYHTIPLPVFQYSISDQLGKLGRLGSQMKYSLFELQKLLFKYKGFLKECFDADLNTINMLNILRKHNECIVYAINLLSTANSKNEQQLTEEYQLNFMNNVENRMNQNSVEMQISDCFYKEIFEKLKILFKLDKETANYDFMMKFQEIITDFMHFHVPLPRAFFQTLQKTHIQLIVTPNAKKTNNLIQIKHDQTLVLKIEGIIKQQFKEDQPMRKISKVQVSLITELDQKIMLEKSYGKYTNIQSCLEEPRNDYFNCQLLVNFPFIGANYILQIEVQIFDNDGMSWNYTAGKQIMFVKVDEDPLSRKMPIKPTNINLPTSSSQHIATPVHMDTLITAETPDHMET